MYRNDTIAAISTALGEGAIGIVRLSGPEAVELANQVYRGKDLTQVDSHTIHYGHIVDPKSQQVIDEVMVSVMRAPRSFTTEDVVEINCHGGIVSVQRILELVLSVGARLAEPGEFTQRAFMHGRIDLSQAEAIMDLIRAKTTRAMDASMQQLQGSLSTRIRELRDLMMQTMATVEVTIDYPEYDDVEELSQQELLASANEVSDRIQQLLNQAQRGRLFREGIRTAIVGRPNVGKSSLLNALSGEQKAIVTEIEGTTRDTIEEYINVRGVPLQLIDTAGIRQTDELVEQIGVKRSREVMASADLVILVIDRSQELQAVDYELLELTKGQNRIILLNKSDLPAQTSMDELLNWVSADKIIETSMLEESGLEVLEEVIEDRFLTGQIEQTDMNYLLNTRHIQLLNDAKASLEAVKEGIALEMPVDLVQMDFVHAWELLGEITGETVQDELLDTLFSEFCLGK